MKKINKKEYCLANRAKNAAEYTKKQYDKYNHYIDLISLLMEDLYEKFAELGEVWTKNNR